MQKYRISAVNYLNTKPFLYGIFKSDLHETIDLQLDIPSVCASKMLNGDVDLGLVPVAVIPRLVDPQIVMDYCIGSVGKVKTVALFSEVPIDAVQSIYLDYHSRTSVELLKILLKKYWAKDPVLLDAGPGFEAKISGTTAGLVIGDRTIGLEYRYPHVYDLGEMWTEFTGLPFVYAAWVANKPLPPAFLDRFNAALKLGIDSIPQLLYILPTPTKGFDLKTYFTENISYDLDVAKKAGLTRFFEEMKADMPVLMSSPVAG